MPFTFIVMADPQFGIFAHQAKKAADEAALRGEGPPEPLFSHWEKEKRLFGRAIEEANRLKPEFVAICGDMVMRWDDREKIGSVREVAGGLDPAVPLHWVPGNHDVGIDFFTPSPESLNSYRQTFGPDYYAFTAGPARFVAINTPLFDHPELVEDEYDRQLDWLREELGSPLPAGVTQRIVFSHHPPFQERPDEDDVVYNLPLARRKVLLDLLNGAGVRAIFAGHTHLDVLAAHDGLEVVASASTCYNRLSQPSGYRVVEVTETSIRHSFHTIDDPGPVNR